MRSLSWRRAWGMKRAAGADMPLFEAYAWPRNLCAGTGFARRGGMTTHALSPLARSSAGHSHPIVRARRLAAGVLTCATVVFAIALVAVYGVAGFLAIAVAIPLPILFIWAS